MRVLGVIPARLGSRRLPRKVLRPIAGVPMVLRVAERAARAGALDEVLVATDAPEVVQVCRDAGVAVELTGEHPSGSDRVLEVARRRPADLYVNVQGDEPLLDPGHVDTLVGLFGELPRPAVATLAAPMPDGAGGEDRVKVVLDARGFALYFSRAEIPHGPAPRLLHLGIYAYTREALERFAGAGPCELELSERLEQLRFLHLGIEVRVGLVERPGIAVDTEADLERVETLLG